MRNKTEGIELVMENEVVFESLKRYSGRYCDKHSLGIINYAENFMT